MRKYLLMKMNKFQIKFSSIQNSFRLKIYKNSFRQPIRKILFLSEVINFVRMLKKFMKKQKTKGRKFLIIFKPSQIGWKL